MDWIEYLIIGLALGWAFKLIFDFWVCGWHSRGLENRLDDCRSDHKASQEKLAETRSLVAQYQADTDCLKQCRVYLALMTDKHRSQETLGQHLAHQLETSESQVSVLGRQLEAVTGERDQFHESLEDLGRWVEAAMRGRGQDTSLRQERLSRYKERSAGHTQVLAATPASQFDRAAGWIGNGASKLKQQWGQSLHSSAARPRFNKTFCIMRAWIATFFKRVELSPSCALDRQ